MSGAAFFFFIMITFRVKTDLSGLERYRRSVRMDLRGSGAGPVRKAIKQWGFRYRAFARDRYITYSRGGGDWQPLKPATIRGKRNQSEGILVDTGVLLTSFTPQFVGKPGQLDDQIPFGVRVGIGPGSHPDAELTLSELAAIHQFGLGNVPERMIVVPPDDKTVEGMADDMDRALQALK